MLYETSLRFQAAIVDLHQRVDDSRLGKWTTLQNYVQLADRTARAGEYLDVALAARDGALVDHGAGAAAGIVGRPIRLAECVGAVGR